MTGRRERDREGGRPDVNKGTSRVKQRAGVDGVGVILVGKKNDFLLSHWIVWAF